MEQGNEGDEILFLSLRQLDCPVNAITSFTPEILFEVIAKALVIITQGDFKINASLPGSIAAKHRACTELATRVKSLGFSGDCGYNQILYPVESSTRALLQWVAQKLPRTDDDTTDDALGGSTLVNKNIQKFLRAWKSEVYNLPGAQFKPNIYSSDCNGTLRTARSLATLKSICNSCSQSNVSIAHSVLERHSLNNLKEIEYTENLERSLIKDSESYQSTKMIAKAALASAKQKAKGVLSNRNGPSSSSAKESKSLNASLQEMLQSIENERDQNSDAQNKFGRGTNFMNSTKFSQETESSILMQQDEGATSSNLSSNSSKPDEGPKSTDPDSAANQDSSDNNGSVNESQKAKDSSTNNRKSVDLKQMKMDKEEKLRAEEIERLKAALQSADIQAEQIERHQSNLVSQIRQIENEVHKIQQESSHLEEEIVLKRKTLEMLPTAADNIEKLQTICGNSAKRLMQLALEWESHRQPQIDKLRALKRRKFQRREKCKTMVEDMKNYRQEMIVMVQDLKDKQERAQLLAEEVSKLPRNINRTLYTYRIMDIIASIGKQNKEIDKITLDIREIQKTINSNSNTLQRADAIAEDKIYSAANGPNSDHAMVTAYRNLITLRSKFDSLISTVNKVGQLDKLTRDLETKINQELARVSSNNFDRIMADLEQVKADNQRLISALKGKK